MEFSVMKHRTFTVFLFAALTACLLQAADKAPMFSASSLRPGDVLEISVFRSSEFSKSVRIEEDGTFQFPLCGEINAAGMTPKSVARELEKRLRDKKLITDPQVDVFVSTWAQRTVYILGEVKTSMSLELPTYGHMTALQAISTAGGFTESADLTRVAVLRRDASGKNLVRLAVDVTALASMGSGGDSFILEPEDTLIVPKASPVFITGLIGTTGAQNIDTQNPPLCSELIVRCGGLQDGADQENIKIIRTDENGKTNVLIISIKMRADGTFENDIRIKPGDYIVASAATQIQVFGEVNTQGPLTLRPDETITASQAITRAGGFKASAKKNDVILIRDKEFRHLNLKRLYEDERSLNNDETLKNGDILFVKESLF